MRASVFSPLSPEATVLGIKEQLAEQHRISTDPNWLAPPPIDEPEPTPPRDRLGRTRRKIESQRLILEACRSLMMRGELRPSMKDCCALAGRSLRTGFEVIGSADTLRLEALKDRAVREQVLDYACGPLDLPEATKWRILKAIVTGTGG